MSRDVRCRRHWTPTVTRLSASSVYDSSFSPRAHDVECAVTLPEAVTHAATSILYRGERSARFAIVMRQLIGKRQCRLGPRLSATTLRYTIACSTRLLQQKGQTVREEFTAIKD